MKKYVLAKNIPDHPEGTPLTDSGCRTWFTPFAGDCAVMEFKESDLKRAIEQGWVKEVEDRRRIFQQIDSFNNYSVFQDGMMQFTPEEIARMERDLNGELMERVDLRGFIKWFLEVSPPVACGGSSHAELLQAFNNREK